MVDPLTTFLILPSTIKRAAVLSVNSSVLILFCLGRSSLGLNLALFRPQDQNLGCCENIPTQYFLVKNILIFNEEGYNGERNIKV